MIPTPAAPIQLFDTMRMTANPIIPASSLATGGTQGLEFFFGSGETIRPVPFRRSSITFSSTGPQSFVKRFSLEHSVGGRNVQFGRCRSDCRGKPAVDEDAGRWS